MSEIARLGANDMVLGITGTNGVTYNLDDMSSMVQGMTFSHTLNISPDADEIAGVQYQSVANALTYIGTQTPVPSDTNRWALWVSGTLSENIDLGSMAYIHIVGTGNALLTGTVTNSDTSFTFSQLPGLVVSNPWAIYNCTISNFTSSGASFTVFENCKITGASITGSSGAYINGGMVTGGTFNAAMVSIMKSFVTGGYFGDSSGSGNGFFVIAQSYVAGGGTFYTGAMIFKCIIVPSTTSSPVLAGGNYSNSYLVGRPTVSFPANSMYQFYDCDLCDDDLDWVIPDGRNVTLELSHVAGYRGIDVGSGSTLTAIKCLGGSGINLSDGATFDYSDGVTILGADIKDSAIEDATINDTTINDTTIGASTPSTGNFTTLTASTVVLPVKTPVNAVAATGTLTASVNPTANDTVTIDTVTYTFVTATPADGQVLIGSTIADTMNNLQAALATHSTVTATNGSIDSQKVFTARTKGISGNSIAVSVSNSSSLSWGSGVTTLAGGIDGTVGVANEVCMDASYVYYCIAANTVADVNWRRMALSTSF